MTIGFRAAGTITTGISAGPVTPALPVGWQAGDLHVMCVVTKANPPPQVLRLPGWSTPINASITGGAGTVGATSGGPIQVTLLTRVARAGDAAPSVTLTSSPTPLQIFILGYTKDAGNVWAPVVCTAAGDTTGSTTSYGTVTGPDTLVYAAGDWLGEFTGFNDDAGTPGAATLTGGTGVTLGTLVARVANVATTTGSDGMVDVRDAPYSSGTASAGPTFGQAFTGTPIANFSGATIFYRLREAAPNNTAPTFVSYTEADHSTTTSPKSTASISWNADDRILVIGGTDTSSATISTPTATGLTLLPAPIPIVVASTCWGQAWTCTAAAGGSSTFTASRTGTVNNWGFSVWVFRNSDGFGADSGVATTAKTIVLDRMDDNSAVVFAAFDFNADTITGRTWTPAGANERDATDGVNLSNFAADWGDQSTNGETAYGFSGTSSAGQHTKLCYEVLGTLVAAPATGLPALVMAPRVVT